ncbi:hypothetical protein ACQEVI_24945 [Promicromonospora sp. CA-289599]|uniref:hypothetical protein n=1 Tax=Promicromonospora sp. CA-289599 TaxID=3240014 RepID=UPI003D8E97F2
MEPIGVLSAVVAFWVGLFPWLPYPVRVPVSAVAAVIAVRLSLRWLVPLVGRVLGGVGPVLTDVICSVLLYVDLLWSSLLVRIRRPFPVILRRYGALVEDAVDLLGRALGLLSGALARAAKAGVGLAVAVVAVVILLINVPGVADGGSGGENDVPMTSWWNQVGAWVEGSSDVQKPSDGKRSGESEE